MWWWKELRKLFFSLYIIGDPYFNTTFGAEPAKCGVEIAIPYIIMSFMILCNDWVIWACWKFYNFICFSICCFFVPCILQIGRRFGILVKSVLHTVFLLEYQETPLTLCIFDEVPCRCPVQFLCAYKCVMNLEDNLRPKCVSLLKRAFYNESPH